MFLNLSSLKYITLGDTAATGNFHHHPRNHNAPAFQIAPVTTGQKQTV
jgi:hypothetical protein